MAPCSLCPPEAPRRALIRRPKTGQAVCKECFFRVFETEVHHTILGFAQGEAGSAAGASVKGKGRAVPGEDHDDQRGADAEAEPARRGLFRRGERVAIGASGGKGEFHAVLLFSLSYSSWSTARFAASRGLFASCELAGAVQGCRPRVGVAYTACGGWRQAASHLRHLPDVPAAPCRAKALTFSIADADSTVLAYIMTLLNKRYDYGLDLCLLSIDEGISGYRDASLDVSRDPTLVQSAPARES